jgi:competence ComEA-like helix-hairpin-helix protein
MKQTWVYVSGAALIFSVALVPTAASPQAQSSPAIAKPAKVTDPPVKEMSAEQEQKWAAETEALVERACVSCHPIADMTKVRKTWPDWNNTVARMAALGIEADEDQLTAVKLYMTRYYGQVNVNKARAAELSAVLGLSGKEAAAVVAYRDAHGDFADANALTQVEGIDKAKFTEALEALRFK